MTSNPERKPPARIMRVVPSGTPPSVCRGPNCGARIFRVPIPPSKRNPEGSTIPIDCSVPDGWEPDSEESRQRVTDGSGYGQSHFQLCKDVRQFQRR